MQRRGGQYLYIKCKGVEEYGAGRRQVELSYTMSDIYPLVHIVPEDQEALHRRESELLVLWNELDGERRRRGGAVKEGSSGVFASSKIAQTASSMRRRRRRPAGTL